MNNKVIVIQNTDYHFETTISLYTLLNNLGYDAYIYRYLPDIYDQKQFLLDHYVKIADNYTIQDALCGFVVSAYPNSSVTKENNVPSKNHYVFRVLKNKLIYICHRFKNIKDYTSENITHNNAICLSPIAANIGLDFIHLTDNILVPNHNFSDKVKLTVQGHFQFHNRDFSSLYDVLTSMNIDYSKIMINLIGTHAHDLSVSIKNIPNLVIKRYNHLVEEKFYDILNNETNFLLCLIDPTIRNETYAVERYSSNFNQAMALEKPILCHSFFQSIYNVPGYYYNDSLSFNNALVKILNCSKEKYLELINSFSSIKNTMMLHNKTTISKKINQLGVL